jgi:hypothetical protein
MKFFCCKRWLLDHWPVDQRTKKQKFGLNFIFLAPKRNFFVGILHVCRFGLGQKMQVFTHLLQLIFFPPFQIFRTDFFSLTFLVSVSRHLAGSFISIFKTLLFWSRASNLSLSSYARLDRAQNKKSRAGSGLNIKGSGRAQG